MGQLHLNTKLHPARNMAFMPWIADPREEVVAKAIMAARDTEAEEAMADVHQSRQNLHGCM